MWRHDVNARAFRELSRCFCTISSGDGLSNENRFTRLYICSSLLTMLYGFNRWYCLHSARANFEGFFKLCAPQSASDLMSKLQAQRSKLGFGVSTSHSMKGIIKFSEFSTGEFVLAVTGCVLLSRRAFERSMCQSFSIPSDFDVWRFNSFGEEVREVSDKVLLIKAISLSPLSFFPNNGRLYTPILFRWLFVKSASDTNWLLVVLLGSLVAGCLANFVLNLGIVNRFVGLSLQFKPYLP